MSRVLRVLIVEDREDDAALSVHALTRAGFNVIWDRVETREALEGALRQEPPYDLLLTDFSLPSFDGLAAIALVRSEGFDLPIIMVSGTIGEDAAVEALHAGAQDFVVKGKLARLVPAVERELREAAARGRRKEVERALHVSETRMRRLSESGIIGLYTTDRSGRVKDANDAFLDMVGYTRADLEAGALNWQTMAPPETSRVSAELVGQLDSVGATRPFEKEYLRKDGKRVPVLFAAATVSPAELIVLVLDLSDRRRLEEQFRQAQKMEAVGRLAGGVAHDFNNLLSVVLSYAALAIDSLPPDAPLRADIQEIEAAGRRATELTSQLLSFSRQSVVQPRVMDLNEVLSRLDRMLRRILGEDVQLKTVPGRSLGAIKADPGQVEQVVMNLVVNARDAMPEGGTITLETGNVDLDEGYARDHFGVHAGPHVMLAVSDMGTGMDKETQARIFEPFFTTKGVGKGTGLGLSTVFGIVQQAGGSIWVYSELGKGTTFKIFFPRAVAAGDGASPSIRTSLPPTAPGSARILLVEDDDQLRHLVGNVLRRKGYDVLVAGTPSAAVELSRKTAGSIDLLVTDVVMPGMNGRQLAEVLAAARPAMRVLFMSGYTDNVIVHRGVLDEDVAFLQKPITPDALLRKVKEILDPST